MGTLKISQSNQMGIPTYCVNVLVKLRRETQLPTSNNTILVLHEISFL